MSFHLRISEKVEKDFAKIPVKEIKKILQKIKSLSVDPYPKGNTKITSSVENLYRIRQGNYRILYIVEETNGIKKYFECKSWDVGIKNLFRAGNTNFGAQLTNYLHNPSITNLNQFGYHFNPAKWTPLADDVNAALKANTSLFQTSYWSKYQQLFGFTNTQVAPNDIYGMIDFITTNKLNKIINPL